MTVEEVVREIEALCPGVPISVEYNTHGEFRWTLHVQMRAHDGRPSYVVRADDLCLLSERFACRMMEAHL